MIVDLWENGAQYRNTRGDWCQVWYGQDLESGAWYVTEDCDGFAIVADEDEDGRPSRPSVDGPFASREVAILRCREHAGLNSNPDTLANDERGAK